MKELSAPERKLVSKGLPEVKWLSTYLFGDLKFWGNFVPSTETSPLTSGSKVPKPAATIVTVSLMKSCSKGLHRWPETQTRTQVFWDWLRVLLTIRLFLKEWDSPSWKIASLNSLRQLQLKTKSWLLLKTTITLNQKRLEHRLTNQVI